MRVNNGGRAMIRAGFARGVCTRGALSIRLKDTTLILKTSE
ncbi:MAG: hypothetical protein AAF999_16110 [Pseudomonadota bacterium]